MNLDLESSRSMSRIVKALDLSTLNKTEQTLFLKRLDENFPTLFKLLFDIYGHKYDYFFYLQELVNVLANNFKARSKKLKNKDKIREREPEWYLQENMLGMACYVDLFSGDLQNLTRKIPYLTSLGITYLHLMPLFDSPKGDSDGGYAVSDYRKVNEKLGTNDDLVALADALANANISLILDFVFNHTSDEHQWALAAKQGDKEHQNFYYMFDDKSTPDLYERNLREIFPQVRRGNFTWDSDCNKWVWTTFNNFQWDLNYSNPAVFNAITDEMLYLANLGCEGLRLDALAFIWKDMGTSCENQPKAHSLIKAFNCCLKIAAPAVVFKSEAIVHPDEVLKYIGKDECQLSYNPLLMALIWNSLATRKTRLLTESMRKSFGIAADCAWVNYVRCHDDIGWTFDDNIAQNLGIQGNDHRHFLNQFYTGRFEGSFATGVAFAENPSTGDCRVCGSLASLAGLEQALTSGDKDLLQNAINRILLVHAIILSIGGIPLLFSGDELGLLNDYSYSKDESKKHDGRWVNRIAITDESIKMSKDTKTPQFEIATGLEKLIKLRKDNPIFGQSKTLIVESDNVHIFAYCRHDDKGNKMLAICNFSEYKQQVNSEILNHIGQQTGKDLISNAHYEMNNKHFELAAYQVVWLTR